MSKVKKVTLFKFIPTKETIFAMALGSVAVLLSVLMGITEVKGLRMFLRSICQMGIVGVILPLWYLNKKGELYKSGIRWEKPIKMFLISIILGLCLTLIFIKEAGGHINNLFGPSYIQATVYIMIANVFEVVFFFTFMRYYFEKAFGVIPAILLASLFYSFHHAGFQPEFLKLFIVGVVFISIFRLANNCLICFPLWWVGGLGDVLVMNQQEMDNTRLTFVGITPVILCFAFVTGIIVWKEYRNKIRIAVD